MELQKKYNDSRISEDRDFCIKENFWMAYQKRYQFISKPEQISLLANSYSNKKYTWNYNF
jgi:hypothetical protein